jgi:beta-xylosidase
MVAVCVFGFSASAEERKSFVPGAVWPDNEGVHINAHGGGFLFHEGTYYWFGEHKIAGRKGNSAQVGVRCYSSRDLYNWKNEGVALAVSNNPDSDIAKGCILERPKVIFNRATQQFVMWFHLELKGEGYSSARSGVAVSDRVSGPYRFVESFRPNGAMARDQTLFVDDDGAAYHLYASENNATLHISRLTDDYLKPSGEYRRIFEKRSMEAPAICKKDGKYYFLGSGCTGWRPNAARSAVASHIFGPWEELGNPCAGTNSVLGAGPEKTFGGQSTYLLPVHGKKDSVIAVFDVWTPRNPIDGAYLFLPVRFEGGGFEINWRDEWTLDDL